MRLQVTIDDDLMAEALAITGCKTVKQVVEPALRTLLELEAKRQARAPRT